MAKQKPPDPKGKITGFPYSILWEEFAEIWQDLEPRSEIVGKYEKLIGRLAERGTIHRPFPTRDDVVRIVGDLELRISAPEVLFDRLYAIAAAYSLPRLRTELGIGARATAKHLARVSRLAKQLAQALGETELQIEVILGMVRGLVVDPGTNPLFHFKELIAELEALASSSEICASEIPNLPRGNSINVMQVRLMQAATKAIGDASSIEIEVKQFDGIGPSPRPGSASADVLFSYLDLVAPSMTDATKVRLFRAFSKSWFPVTREEIDRDEFPRKLRARQRARARIEI